MSSSGRLDGLKELDDALGELPKATARNVLQRALIQAGEPIRAAAEAMAPERPANAPVETFVRDGVVKVRRIGTSKALVQIGTKLTPRQARAARQGGKDFAEVYVGTRDRLSGLEEFGTSRTRPHPFMRPAVDQNIDKVNAAFADALKTQIDAAVQRLAKKAAKAAGG